jgi:peptide/nickel transport system permease protein
VAPAAVRPPPRRRLRTALLLLYRDKLAFIAATFLFILFVAAIVGPPFVANEAVTMNLRARNLPPFSTDHGWMFVLGSDALGRSILARIIYASSTTLAIAVASVVLSMIVGTLFGLIAGLRGGWVSNLILRLADVLMSFPSLLLALVILYVFSPAPEAVIAVLALSRVPIYLRTVRAEVMEIRGRLFVLAARTLGASPPRLIIRHMLPIVMPTLVTIATLDFAYMMLTESSLSFLGLGVQSPSISWGLMVAEGKNYLVSAWWLSFWPGLAIMLTTLAANLLSNWVRIVTDPVQRWRLEHQGGGDEEATDNV